MSVIIIEPHAHRCQRTAAAPAVQGARARSAGGCLGPAISL